MPLAGIVSVITGDTWDYINLTHSNCHQNLYWCEWSIFLLSETTLYVKYVLLAVPFLISGFHPAIREEDYSMELSCKTASMSLIHPGSKHHSVSKIPHSLNPPAYIMVSVIPTEVLPAQKTMVMSTMYECNPSVDHDTYKILTATIMVIDINDATLQIPANCNYFGVENPSCN